MYIGTIKEKVSVCRPRWHKGEWREWSNQSHPRQYMVVTAELHGTAALSLGKGVSGQRTPDLIRTLWKKDKCMHTRTHNLRFPWLSSG